MPDPLQQLDVVVTVAVEKALLEVDAELAGQVLGRIHLALPKAQGPDDPAREHAVCYLVATADHVLYAQFARHGLDLVGRGR